MAPVSMDKLHGRLVFVLSFTHAFLLLTPWDPRQNIQKDKRFLRNMGKGIKKVMNYPRTPVHDVVPSPSGTTGNASIGAEEEGSVVSGAPTPSNSGSSGGGNASVTSTDAVASSTGSSSTASTPLRTSSARKFFAAATAPGKAKAATAAAEGERSSA